jgi:predicted RND superfamily exporter protein
VTSSARAPDPFARAFLAFVLKHGRTLWAVALLLAIPATVRTVRLYAHLRSDLEELLPRSAPSVAAIDEMRRRNAGLQYLGVMLDTGDAAHLAEGEKFLDELAARLKKLPPELVREVRTGTAEERAFVEGHAALYLDLPDLETIARRIEERHQYEIAKAMGMLLDEDTPAPSIDMSDIEARYRGRIEANQRPHDRFSSADDHLTMLFVEAGGFSTGVESARALLDRVKAEVRALDPQKHGFRIGYASDVAISVEELDALVTDLSYTSILVVLAVMGVILAYYRWWKSVTVLMAPLLVATVFAFSLASLPPFDVTELNSNTAFLGSIIVGNGINFGIILLARYREERRRGKSVEDALAVGITGARAGTLAAAFGAGVSYASLVFTEFRGFRQFGYIGGLGMIVSWVTAFVLMPSLIRFLDRDVAPKSARLDGAGSMARLVRVVHAVPGPLVAVATVVTLLSAFVVSRIDSSFLEYDFSKLRRYDTWENGEGYWGRRMDHLLGHYLTPTMVLFDSQEAAERGAARIKASVEHGGLGRYVATVRTIDDVVPPDQPAKIAAVARIQKALTPLMREEIPEAQRAELDLYLSAGHLGTVTAENTPRVLLTGLRERDGRSGRQVLLYPKPSRDLWRAEAMAEFTGTLRSLAATGIGKPGRVAGSIPLSSDICESIRRDAPQASMISLAGVILVVLFALRARRGAYYVIGSLIVGVLWQVACTKLLGVKVSFANFIAFPITFGIGVDYAVNVIARYAQDGDDDPGPAMLSTGGAVGLCSMTTIIGYSSLLLAKNRALYSFGLVAVLGEIACLVTAIIVLPALLFWLVRWRARGRATAS